MLVTCLQDGHVQVRGSTAWALATICALHKNSISGEIVPVMIAGLTKALEDADAYVASKACYAVHNFAAACEDDNEAPSNLLSRCMPDLLGRLFVLAARADGDVENLRINAYEAIGMIVSNSAEDMKPIVVQVFVETLSRLEPTFSATFPSAERQELQSNLCLIGWCCKKLTVQDIAPHSDRAMTLLLQVFQTKSAHAHEDAFIAIGHFADRLGPDFARYVPFVQPPLLAGMKNYEEFQVCTIAVGVVSDICRAISKQVLPYCDDIVRSLIELLQAPTLNKVVKPYALSSFADIALAIEGEFERYSNIVLAMLQQAGEITIPAGTDDEDMVDYINSLHAAILEAYSGIVHGFSAANKEDGLLVVMESMFEFVLRVGSNEKKSEEVLKYCVGLIGDLGQVYGRKLHTFFRQPVVAALIDEASHDEEIEETAGWAREMVTAALA